MKKIIKGLIPDILALGGAACVAYGAFLFGEIAGFITSGVLLIMGAFVFSRGGDDG